MTPTSSQVTVCYLAAGSGVGQHGLGLRRPEARQPLAHALVRARDDRRGEQRRVDGAGAADRERPDRHAGRHLHDREQRVHALQRLRLDRHAEHRQRRLRRRHARAGAPRRRRRRSAPAGRAPPPMAAYSKSRSGVRWAETTRCSYGTSSSSSVSHACRIVSQSEREPMITPTSGLIAGWRASAAGARPTSRSCAPPPPARRRRRGRSGSGSSRAAASRSSGRRSRAGGPRCSDRWTASSCSSARMLFTSPGWSRESPSRRDQRRAARRRALVLQPAPQQLELLPEAELRDRAVGLGADRGSRGCAPRPRARRPTAGAASRAPSGRRRRPARRRELPPPLSVIRSRRPERAPGPT